METLLLALRCGLAAVFAIAGARKLLHPAGFGDALAQFGISARLATIAAIALPVVELAVGMALLFRTSARWGAVAAVALLLVFTIGIVRTLAQGRRPRCHCFGDVHSKPVGKETLARNVALAMLGAVVAAIGPGPSVQELVAARPVSELLVTGLLVVAVGALTFLLSAGLPDRAAATPGSTRHDPMGLSSGIPAPDFALTDVADATVVRGLDSLRGRGRPVVLVFVHPRCGPCQDLLPALSRWQVGLQERLTIALVTEGEMDENRAATERHGLVDVLLQQRSEVYDAYRMPGTPSAVVVLVDGRIGSATATGVLPIEELIRLTLRGPHAATEPPRAELIG